MSHMPEGYYLIPSGPQQRDPGNSAKLAELLAFYFREELKQVKLPINIFIDPNLPKNEAGQTYRTKDNRIVIRINTTVFSDAKELYVTIAHELIHAREYNPGGYYDHFLKIVRGDDPEDDKIRAIMEYHGYMVGSRAAEGLNLSPNDETKNFQHYMYHLEYFGLINEVNEYLSKER